MKSNFLSSLKRPRCLVLCLAACCLLSFTGSGLAKNTNYEVLVHGGEVEITIEILKDRDFWGPTSHNKDLDVPRLILVVASKRWAKESQKITVHEKKEVFYRVIVPMVLLANELILEERQELLKMSKDLEKGAELSAPQKNRLQALGQIYGLGDVTGQSELLAGLLLRVDSIPPSLALGQAAYESGYGTSRFATEGNALFGQWTYGGDGMKPKEHRASKGNYGVASYHWPFDSVRSYMQNLNSHGAYQKLRDLRASLHAKGTPVTGILLAETLDKYSERGMEYVKTLQSMIRVNGLDIADTAYLRDEPTTLLVGVGRDDEVEETEAKIAELQASGELWRIIQSMHLTGE